MEDTTPAAEPVQEAEYHVNEDGKSFIDLMDDNFPVLDSEEAKLGRETLQESQVKEKKPDAKEAKEAKKTSKEEPAAADDPLPDDDDAPSFEEADSFFAEEQDAEDKSAEKPADAFDEADFDKQTDELSKGLEMKAGEKFKSLRAELKEAKQVALNARPAPETEKELEDLRLKAQELEGLRSKVEELSNVSAKAKLQADDEYRKRVLAPSADIASSLNELATSYEIDPKVLKSIVSTSDRKEQNALIEEYLVNFSELDRQEVYGHIREFRNISKLSGEMLADAGRKLTELEARKVEAERTEREDRRKNVLTLQKSIWDKYQKILPGLQDEDGDPSPAYDELVNRSLAVDFSKARGSDEAFAAFAGVALPHVIKQMAAMRKELDSYRKNESKTNRAKPKLGGTTPAVRSEEDPRSFVDRFADVKF